MEIVLSRYLLPPSRRQEWFTISFEIQSSEVQQFFSITYVTEKWFLGSTHLFCSILGSSISEQLEIKLYFSFKQNKLIITDHLVEEE